MGECGIWLHEDTAQVNRVIEVLRLFARDGDKRIGVQTENGIEYDFGVTTCNGDLVIVPNSLVSVHEESKYGKCISKNKVYFK